MCKGYAISMCVSAVLCPCVSAGTVIEVESDREACQRREKYMNMNSCVIRGIHYW